MRIFFNKSRFSYGILLILLILSISGVFLSLYNQLATAKLETPLLAIVFTIASIVLGIILFQLGSNASSKLMRSNQQLDQLKKSIQESKKQSLEEEKAEDKEVKIQINVREEVNNFIPEGSFQSQELFMEKLLSNISSKNDIVQAIAFSKDEKTQMFSVLASYAYFSESDPPTFSEGETLPGQVVKNKVALNLKEIPEDYITVISGLGKGTPNNLLIVPILNQEKECLGVIEFASFSIFNEQKVKLFETLGLMINEHLTTIGNSTTE
jgi:uncharacterized membrane protein (DUF485 family)